MSGKYLYPSMFKHVSTFAFVRGIIRCRAVEEDERTPVILLVKMSQRNVGGQRSTVNGGLRLTSGLILWFMNTLRPLWNQPAAYLIGYFGSWPNGVGAIPEHYH